MVFSTGETAVVSSCDYRFSCSHRSRYILHKWFFCRGRSTKFNTRQIYKHTDYRVGLTVTESFITSTDDTTLLDNATGSSNANATGGTHRYKIDLTLAKLTEASTVILVLLSCLD